MLGDLVESQLTHDEAHQRGSRGGQKEARKPAQRRLADGNQGGLLVPGLVQLHRLERADVASDKGENGDADATLGEDAQVRPLEQARRGVLVIGGAEEIHVPGAA